MCSHGMRADMAAWFDQLRTAGISMFFGVKDEDDIDYLLDVVAMVAVACPDDVHTDFSAVDPVVSRLERRRDIHGCAIVEVKVVRFCDLDKFQTQSSEGFIQDVQ